MTEGSSLNLTYVSYSIKKPITMPSSICFMTESYLLGRVFANSLITLEISNFGFSLKKTKHAISLIANLLSPHQGTALVEERACFLISV